MEQFPLRMSNWLFKVMEELVIKTLSFTHHGFMGKNLIHTLRVFFIINVDVGKSVGQKKRA